MQAATELQFLHENLGIYLKLLLLKSCDYKVFTGNTSLLICNSEKLEHRKLRSLKTNESNPCYIDFKAVLWFEKEGKGCTLHFQYVQSVGVVFDIMLTATCHKDKMQPMLINRDLAISTHMAFSNLYFQRINLSLVFALSNESQNTWNLGV